MKRVRSDVVARRFLAGQSISEIAFDNGVYMHDVEAALRRAFAAAERKVRR